MQSEARYEVSKRDFSEVSTSMIKTEMEEAKQEGWDLESPCCMGTIIVAHLRYDGVDLY